MIATRSRIAGPALLLATLLAVFVIDRCLLAYFGLPPWEADAALQFRLRPGARPAWNLADPQTIDRWGFYDDEFPLAKPPGEVRLVALGDSVMMGHGVSIRDALPNQLETRLTASSGGTPPYQVINTGVQGYWTAQYPEMLRRTLQFEPDVVLLGFSMNDVVTFYSLDTAHGGTGLDYHGVQLVSNPWLSYLVNETGFGRLAVFLRQSRAEVAYAQRREKFSVARVAAHSHDDPEIVAGWRRSLDDLTAVYDLAAQHRVPVVQLIFPEDFQLGHPELGEPQRIVARHAEARGVPVLDVTALFEREIATGAMPTDLYLDGVHFTPRGHAVVAAALQELLAERHLLPAPNGAPTRSAASQPQGSQ